MKMISLLCFNFFISLISAISSQPYEYDWDSFKIIFNKSYGDKSEENYRKKVFLENVKDISDHNEKFKLDQTSYKLSINQFSDTTSEEFEAEFPFPDMSYVQADISKVQAPSQNLSILPESVNWRKRGAVTSVGNQFYCGACWSFSALGAVEGQSYLKTGQLIKLSVSNLLDCSTDREYVDHGCHGGEIQVAFDYIQKHGIQAESTYKYVGKEQDCFFQEDLKVLQTKGYKWVHASENALKEAVANIGPISVQIQFSNFIKHYSSGIYFNNDCSSIVNHAVLVVGYGTENGQDYWLIKNSHGESWGEEGYLKLARNKQRHCGIGKYSIYPLV